MAMMLSTTTNTMPPKLNASGGRVGYAQSATTATSTTSDEVTKADIANAMADQSCTFCWSTTTLNNNNTNGGGAGEGYYSSPGKARKIRLRKTNEQQSLGFSIRGGWEHGIGFFISDVQPDSIAAKQGLCPGDQILRINGFPLERVIHDEVVALIRMSSNDLTLRVCSMGVVPCKAQGVERGKQLLWKRTSTLSSSRTGISVTDSVIESCPLEGASVTNSFVYSRPRSVCSLMTPSSSTPSTISSEGDAGHLSSSDESNDPLMLGNGGGRKAPPPPLPVRSINQQQQQQQQQVQHIQHQDEEEEEDEIYCTKYTEKQIYIRAHPPDTSLGCSVVNGPPYCPGIFVQHIKEGRLAAKCGLEIGDQIVKVNNIDVSLMGFDNAITLLKTLDNFSLVVRKGVAKHIFEMCHGVHQCESLYSVVGPTVTTLTTTECHQYQCQSQTHALPPLPHHHHRACSSPPPDYNQSNTSETSSITCGQNYCSATTTTAAAATSYSTVQIANTIGAPPPPPPMPAANRAVVNTSCDKARCCCKRQRIKDMYLVSPAAGINTLVVPPPPPPPPGQAQISAAPGTTPMCTFSGDQLDNVTSAMANSIRILQEVREKEEKLVEASRKLNEEHLKLCREKEKLEHEKKELSAAKENGGMLHKPPSMMNSSDQAAGSSSGGACVSIAAQFSSVTTGPMLGRGTVNGFPNNSSGPSFSFLEEIKALGVDGGKRHLRPVNSNDSRRDSSSTTASGADQDKLNKLRQSPFALNSQMAKDAAKRRQHELLMEEFRIAHKKMFGGLKKTGLRGALVEENKEDEETKVEETVAAALSPAASQPPPPTQQQQLTSKSNQSHAPLAKTRNVLSKDFPQQQQQQQRTVKADEGKARAHQPKPSMKTFPAPPPPPPTNNNNNDHHHHKNKSNNNQEQKTTESERTTVTASSSSNRITIKVISPKLPSIS